MPTDEKKRPNQYLPLDLELDLQATAYLLYDALTFHIAYDIRPTHFLIAHLFSLVAPPILLLDESTSSLDGLNEQRMREAIDAVAKNRTMIVIAHRLSTVIDSDQIIVIDGGKVIGAGTHKQLLRSTPLYKELAATQMLS